MLKITPGYKSFVKIFAKRQTDVSAVYSEIIDDTLVHDQQSFNGRMAHFFQAIAVSRNNTNTHNYETNIYNPYLPGQAD
jgi:hypothetical protein